MESLLSGVIIGNSYKTLNEIISCSCIILKNCLSVNWIPLMFWGCRSEHSRTHKQYFNSDSTDFPYELFQDNLKLSYGLNFSWNSSILNIFFLLFVNISMYLVMFIVSLVYLYSPLMVSVYSIKEFM